MNYEPHPNCHAPHKSKFDYVGAEHACVGNGCKAADHQTPHTPTPKKQAKRKVARK
jgi:hypothetical protein